MEFYYQIIFRTSKQLTISVIVSYEDEQALAFFRTYSSDVLTDKSQFNEIFKQIKEYFDFKHIKMTKNDLHLFYNTLIECDITLPSIGNVTIVDEIEPLGPQLSPKEILFLLYIDGKKKGQQVAQYWEQDYHLDTLYTLAKLENEGYLTFADTVYNMEHALKRELEQVLKDHGLPFSGNKPVLIERVLTLGKEIVKTSFEQEYCKVTDIGQVTCKKFAYLNDFHSSYYRYTHQLQIEEFFLLSKKMDKLEAKEVCKIMIDNKAKDVTDFDWDSFFNEVNKKQVNVKEEDEITKIINKYSSLNKPAETKPIKQVSDQEFLNIVFGQAEQPKVEQTNKKEEIKINKEKIIELLDEQEMPNTKEKVLPLYMKRFLLSSLFSTIIVYVLYQFIFR